ncbi:hypothetical protein Hanom_Chr14g01265041 [Helianthus anomalus]
MITKAGSLALMAEIQELDDTEIVERRDDVLKIDKAEAEDAKEVKVVEEVQEEIKFDEAPEEFVEAESTTFDVEPIEIPTKEEANYEDLYFSDDEQEPFVEIIDVSKEMNAEHRNK